MKLIYLTENNLYCSSIFPNAMFDMMVFKRLGQVLLCFCIFGALLQNFTLSYPMHITAPYGMDDVCLFKKVEVLSKGDSDMLLSPVNNSFS